MTHELPTSQSGNEQMVAVWAEALADEGVELTTPGLINALGSEFLDVRAGAALLLGRLGPVSATASLSPLLEDQSATVRVEAAMSLNLLGDKTGVPVLITALEEDLSTGAPITAASYLAALGDPRGYKVVLEALQSKLAGIRLSAAVALKSFFPYRGKRVGKQTVDLFLVLKEALKDADPLVRRELLYELAMLDDPRSSSLLLEISHSDADGGIRETAQLLSSSYPRVSESKQ